MESHRVPISAGSQSGGHTELKLPWQVGQCHAHLQRWGFVGVKGYWKANGSLCDKFMFGN